MASSGTRRGPETCSNARYEAPVVAVRAWKDSHVPPRNYEKIALRLTGHARAVAGAMQALLAPNSRASSGTSSAVLGRRIHQLGHVS